MAKSNWDISGTGGQSIIDVEGSKRCQITGIKLMLWNGRNDLINSEVIVSIRPYVNNNSGYQRGGAVLRSDTSGFNYYLLTSYAYTAFRSYLIYRVVDGVSTLLSTVNSYHSYTDFVKTRFRIDGYQLSIEEYVDGIWNLKSTVEDTVHTLVSGYSGLKGHSHTVSYSCLFDNVEISERV